MAADFGVYFSLAKLPSIGQWEQAAADLGVRLRIMPVDLLTHGGTLPVAYEADDYNTVFEFDVTREWGRPTELADVLRAREVFAAFRCYSREWPAALWAAVSFAKASDGLFQDPNGRTFRTFDEALAYARTDSEKRAGEPPGPAVESDLGYRAGDRIPEVSERQTRAIREAEEAWAGKERTCPRCGTVFRSVQNRGGCPECGHIFYASHPKGGSPFGPT